MCPPLPWLCRCSGCCLPRRTPGLQDRAALAGHGDAVADGHRSMKRTCLPREPRSWGSPGHIGNSQLRNHLKEPYTEPGLPGLAESQPQRDPPPGIRHCLKEGWHMPWKSGTPFSTEEQRVKVDPFLHLSSSPAVLRQALRQKHQEAQQACRPHNLPVLQAAQQRELESCPHLPQHHPRPHGRQWSTGSMRSSGRWTGRSSWSWTGRWLTSRAHWRRQGWLAST
nr:protein DGCR6L isoform X5 [Pongo pygmaeus]